MSIAGAFWLWAFGDGRVAACCGSASSTIVVATNKNPAIAFCFASCLTSITIPRRLQPHNETSRDPETSPTNLRRQYRVTHDARTRRLLNRTSRTGCNGRASIHITRAQVSLHAPPPAAYKSKIHGAADRRTGQRNQAGRPLLCGFDADFYGETLGDAGN